MWIGGFDSCDDNDDGNNDDNGADDIVAGGYQRNSMSRPIWIILIYGFAGMCHCFLKEAGIKEMKTNNLSNLCKSSCHLYSYS